MTERRKCADPECDRTLKPNREWQKFCSPLCRLRTWREQKRNEQQSKEATDAHAE